MVINRFCYDLFDRIENTSSRKEKEAIVKEVVDLANRGNDAAQVFLRLIQLALDPRIRFNTRVVPASDNPPSESLIDFRQCITLIEQLPYLRGNENEVHVKHIISQLDVYDAEIIARVILKNLRIGATASTFNKIQPGLIYEHPYMRCSSFDKSFFGKNIKFPCYSQLKADGRYTDVVVTPEGKVKFMARSGLELAVSDFAGIRKAYEAYPGMVFMGEMLALDEYGYEYPREMSNGKLNSDEMTEDLIAQNRVRIYHWDVVPYADWVKGECSLRYEDRFGSLQDAVNNINHPNIQVIETKICNDMNDVVNHFTAFVSKGYEGTVVKDASLIWKDHTSKNQMKVKVEFEVELKIVDVMEGSGKYAGRVGSLKCESECGQLKVGVGIGLKDKDRDALWKIKEQIKGSIVTVGANGILAPSDSNEFYSLFLPRFKNIRSDKVQADDLARIQEQFQAFVESFKLAHQSS